MADRQSAEDLATISDRLAALERREQRRVPRRALSLILAVLLVAIVPLVTLAANPFGDLNPGSPHNGNIDLIFDAGITTGCDPGVAYCPNGTVTREEMASFLARTAGLGNNPPVVNAKTAQSAITAQTATSATNAQNAVNAQNAATAQRAVTAETATSATNAASAQNAQNAVTAQTATNAQNAANATNAQNAANAATLGGQPSSAFLPAAGDTTLYYPGATAIVTAASSGITNTIDGYGGRQVSPSLSNGTANVIVPLARIGGEHGHPLAVKGVRVCYTGGFLVAVTAAGLYANERGSTDTTTLISDATRRDATLPTCYDLTVATPRVIAGQTFLSLTIQVESGALGNLTFHSFALILTPRASGAP